jgi:hypothetical protein
VGSAAGVETGRGAYCGSPPGADTGAGDALATDGCGATIGSSTWSGRSGMAGKSGAGAASDLGGVMRVGCGAGRAVAGVPRSGGIGRRSNGASER